MQADSSPPQGEGSQSQGESSLPQGESSLPASVQAGRFAFTLYSRSYCHLCDDLLDALRNLLNQQQIDPQQVDIAVIDVDADPALVARFDELVPVLFGDPDGPELCHYFLDANAVRGYVAAATVSI